jgi:hypothetical protein
MKDNFKVTHAIETHGRVIYFHFDVDCEQHAEAIAIIESSIGLLTVVVNGTAASYSWPDNEQWGAKTFEAFLCARPAKWLTAKLLGGLATDLDLDRTYKTLVEQLPHHETAITAFVHQLATYGIKASQMLDDDTAELQEALGDPLYDWVFYKPTMLAEFLMNGVVPALQDKLTPPKTETHQQNLLYLS